MRLLLTILLILSFGYSDGQQVINAHVRYRGFVSVSNDLLLDLYPGSAAAYSLRKLDKDYTGSAIRVRKDTTGQPEQDIGFLPSGELDTVSLKSFVLNNSAFVTTWYSQGDSTSVNFTQTTAANQPRIMNAGVIERRNGKPALFFDGSNDFMDVSSSTAKFAFLHQAGQSAVFITFQPGIVADPNAAYMILSNTSTSTQTGIQIVYDDQSSFSRNNRIRSFVTRSSTGNPTVDNVSNDDACLPNVLGLFAFLYDNNNATAANRSFIHYNAGAAINNNTFTNPPNSGNSTYNLRMGRRANATDFNLIGYISEIVIYPTNQSSNRTAIQSNINTFYAIY